MAENGDIICLSHPRKYFEEKLSQKAATGKMRDIHPSWGSHPYLPSKGYQKLLINEHGLEINPAWGFTLRSI